MANFNLMAAEKQDLYEECLRDMAEHGLQLQEPIIADERIHRYSADEKKNKKDEWYIAFAGISKSNNDYLICIYGSWSEDIKYEYRSWKNDNLNEKERKEFILLLKSKREEVERQRREVRNQAAIEASVIWNKSHKKPPSSEYEQYIKAKGIKPIGIKFIKNPYGYSSLVIPINNIDGEICSLQFISMGSEGKSYKSFLSGGEIRGNFCIIGEIIDGNPFYIAEGYATAISVHQASSIPVVIAFNAGNISSVLEHLVKKYPNSKITIAADSDNIGREKASLAAKKYGCNFIYPVFPSGKDRDSNGEQYKDFNDLHNFFGINEVKTQLSNTIEIITIQDELKNLAHNLLEKEEPCDCFSLSALPKILSDYISSICETTNAHPIMVTCSVLATISAILKKKIFIKEDRDTGYFQTLYANLWMLNVTKSGQFKSTALNKGAKLAWEQSASVLKEIRDIDAKINEDNADKKTKKELEDKKILISTKDPLLPNKMTTESLLEHLSQNHAGTILTSEFGAWLQNMDKNHNSDFKAIATDLYDVPHVFRYKTKSSGDYILEKPYMSICGVSTLSWLKANLKPDDVDSGFLARFLIFTPPHQDEIPPALPRKTNKESKASEHKETEQKIKDILEHIEDEHPYILSGEAELYFESIHKQLYQIPKNYSDKCREILDPYLKRWSPVLLKLAMIMRLFEDPFAYDISITSLDSAMAVLLPAIKSTAGLFEGELGESEHQRKCRIIFDWICQKVKKTGDPVKWKDIISSKKLEGGSAEYEYVCKTLTESGKLICKENPTRKDWLYAPSDR